VRVRVGKRQHNERSGCVQPLVVRPKRCEAFTSLEQAGVAARARCCLARSAVAACVKACARRGDIGGGAPARRPASESSSACSVDRPRSSPAAACRHGRHRQPGPVPAGALGTQRALVARGIQTRIVRHSPGKSGTCRPRMPSRRSRRINCPGRVEYASNMLLHVLDRGSSPVAAAIRILPREKNRSPDLPRRTGSWLASVAVVSAESNQARSAVATRSRRPPQARRCLRHRRQRRGSRRSTTTTDHDRAESMPCGVAGRRPRNVGLVGCRPIPSRMPLRGEPVGGVKGSNNVVLVSRKSELGSELDTSRLIRSRSGCATSLLQADAVRLGNGFPSCCHSTQHICAARQ